jgi:purine-nucleoside phosphorylase
MNSFLYLDRLDRAASYLSGKYKTRQMWCVILGSGLGGLGDRLDSINGNISYRDIPGFPRSTVQGHAGKMVLGERAGCGVVIMEGRFHRYEGYDWKTLVLPIRALIRTGVSHFLITNAAGGLRDDLQPGTLMLINDHINLMGGNPLTGPNLDAFGPRFPAMTDCYDVEIRERIKKSALSRNIVLREGVYAALEGPSYETAAEIRMLSLLGADAVGMSTVPEVLAIRHAGCHVAAISMITNNTGDYHMPTHDDVMATAMLRKESLHRIILDVISETRNRKEEKAL